MPFFEPRYAGLAMLRRTPWRDRDASDWTVFAYRATIRAAKARKVVMLHVKTMIQTLLTLISEENPEYLSKEPFKVYEKMLSAGESAKDARLILSALLCDAPKRAKTMKESALSEYIQDECGMRPEVADELAGVFKQIFSRRNAARWKEETGSGLQALQEQPWKFTWEGGAQWRSHGGYVDCSSTVNAVLQVQDIDAVRAAVQPLFKTKPFASVEEIQGLLAEKLFDDLDFEIDSYVTDDDYYEPVMDDLYANAEDVLEKSCQSLGLQVTEFDCDSSQTDFEPDDWY